jgi:hypothetical protein
MSEIILELNVETDGHTVDYWFRKLKLFVALHGGLKWWQGNDKDRRPCTKLCPYGGKDGGWCNRPIGDKRLRATHDLKAMYNVEKGVPERTFCAEWIKHV